MECKIPIIEFPETRITRYGIEIPKMLNAEKRQLPGYLQVGEAWKVFGKWLVAMGQSDQNEVEFTDGMKAGHVCIVLRGIGFTLYFYELIDDYTQEQYQIFKHIRLILDRVLVTNQVASIKLRFYLEKFDSWSGNIFPKFFNTFDNTKIAEWSIQIDEEIEKWSNTEFVFKGLQKKEKYWESITNPKDGDLLWDIKGCYAELLSIFNTIKSDLPKENIAIINELIVRCEHGYFLGFLIEKTLKEFIKDHPDVGKSNQATRTKVYLMNRLKKFRTGREKRVYTASKEAFGLTKEVKEKLKRMFEFKKI